MSEMCHFNAKSLAKRMVDCLLQLCLKIAYVYTYSNKEDYINQLKLVTTTSVTVGQCGNVQNHILNVGVQEAVQFLAQKVNILKQNLNPKNTVSLLKF